MCALRKKQIQCGKISGGGGSNPSTPRPPVTVSFSFQNAEIAQDQAMLKG